MKTRAINGSFRARNEKIRAINGSFRAVNDIYRAIYALIRLYTNGVTIEL